jgi:2-dehydropantoate 2-reductase
VKILVLGAGGIGGYFGGRLAQAGADVTFLVRPKRREQLERGGLVIESASGNARVAVKSLLAEDLRAGYDCVLFTCKAYDLDSAMDAVAPAMRGGDAKCALLPLLNGLAHFEALDRRFGRAQVLGGTAHINAMLRPDGVIVNPDPLNRIIFGERDRSRSARVQAIADAFAKTSVEWKLSDDIEHDLWQKICFLCALASCTCLFRANVGEIVSAPGGREALDRALDANIQIATREGFPPRSKAIEDVRARLTDPEGRWTASMLRDLEAGGPTEADHIVGWMLERARRHGVDDTILSLAYTHLKAYEARRAAGRHILAGAAQ